MSDLAARTTEVAPVREAGGRLADDLRAVRVVWRRELIRFLRNRPRMVTALVQPILFLLVLGSGLARMMPNAGAGIDFRTFMFPGVLAMTVLFTSISSAVSIVWDREFGFMREMLVAPVRRGALVIGKCLGGATVATIQGAIMLVLAGLVHVPYDPALMGLLVLEMALAALALTALTLLDPLSYAVDPMRRAVFAHVTAPPALARMLDPGISWGGWVLPTAAELGLVALLAAIALAFAGARLSRAKLASPATSVVRMGGGRLATGRGRVGPGCAGPGWRSRARVAHWAWGRSAAIM